MATSIFMFSEYHIAFKITTAFLHQHLKQVLVYVREGEKTCNYKSALSVSQKIPFKFCSDIKC